MSEDELDFLGDLEPDPPVTAPKGFPVAPGTPKAHAAPTTTHRLLEFAAVVVVTIGLTIGVTAWWLGGRGDSPAPPPTVNAVTLGHTFGPILAGTLADGFDEGATQLRAGKTLGDADTALKAKFDSARNAAFDAHAGSAIHAIAADGKDLDPAQRAAMIDLFTGFAKGLRGAK